MIVMLYEGAIRQLAEAKLAIAAGSPEARWRHVAKAGAIIEGLQSCLDHRTGGEVARHLDRFYTYVTLRLQQINLRNDPAICDELASNLGTMRASWIAAAARLGAAPLPPPSAPPPSGAVLSY
jgi:flagellar protein FliS